MSRHRIPTFKIHAVLWTEHKGNQSHPDHYTIHITKESADAYASAESSGFGAKDSIYKIVASQPIEMALMSYDLHRKLLVDKVLVIEYSDKDKLLKSIN